VVRLAVHNEDQAQVTFDATHVAVWCEGAADPQPVDFPSTTVRLRKSGFFEGRQRSLASGGLLRLFKFEGRLLEGGRAKGFVFYFSDPLDQSADENEAECSTAGLLRWRATRTARKQSALP